IVGADGASYVDVYDGASPATRLYHFTGTVGDAFGSTVETGDVKGDGKADVLVGASAWHGTAGTDQRYARAVDGATGAQSSSCGATARPTHSARRSRWRTSTGMAG